MGIEPNEHHPPPFSWIFRPNHGVLTTFHRVVSAIHRVISLIHGVFVAIYEQVSPIHRHQLSKP